MARSCAAECFRDWGLGDLTEVGALLVSELVTNAVRHACTPVEVHIDHTPDGARVRVHDDEPSDLPAVVVPSTTAESGRGLVLVDRLARRWGWRRDRDGKDVWFEL